MKRYCMVVYAFIVLCTLAYTAVAQAEDFTFLSPVNSILPTQDGFIATSDKKLYHISSENGAKEVLNLSKFGGDDIITASDGTIWSEINREVEQPDGSVLQWCFARLEEQDGVWAIAEKVFCNERPILPSYTISCSNNTLLVDEKCLSYYYFHNNEGDATYASFVRVSRTEPGDVSVTAANALGAKDLQFLLNYRDDKFLSISHLNLVSFDPRTQQTTVLVRLPEAPDAIGYCAETDTLVYIVDALIYVMPLSTRVATVQGYLPFDRRSRSMSGMSIMALNAQGQCAVADGNVVHLITLSPDFSPEENTLHIASYYRDRAETRQFRLSHPDFPILTKNFSYQLLPADVAEMIRTGDDTYDLFNIRTFERGYRALLEKGFAMDLSSSETLCDWADTLLPAVRDAVMVDGKLMGIPVEISINRDSSFYTADEELLDIYGLTFDQLPDDLLSLLTQLTEWYQDGTLYEVVPFAYNHNYPDIPYSIRSRVLYTYFNYASTKNEWIDLTDPMFTRLMEQAEALIQAMSESNCLQPYPTLLSELPLEQIVSKWKPSSLLPLSKLLLMKCYPEADFNYTVDVSVAIINPLSRHKEQALYYLEEVVKNMDVWTSFFLCPQTAVPVINAATEASLVEMQKELAEWEKTKAGMTPEEWREWDMDHYADSLMEDRRNSIARAQADIYKINEEQIARYRSLCPSAVVLSDTQYTFQNQKQVIAAIQQYHQNTITLEEMIARIQQVITMMQMEE